MRTQIGASSVVAQAAHSDGYAALAGERFKHNHYDGWFPADRYTLVPMVQETYGRMGREGVKFHKQLASRSDRCTVGTDRLVRLHIGLISAWR